MPLLGLDGFSTISIFFISVSGYMSSKSCPVYRVSADGVDIVLDCLCSEECNRGYQLLKPMGRYILYGKFYIFDFYR